MEFNSCSNLLNDEQYKDGEKLYNDIISQGKDPLSEMLKMQTMLQMNLHERLPNQTKDITKLKTIGEKYENIQDNWVAIQDEYRELIDSIPGHSIDAKTRSALWKKWKADYFNVRSKTWEGISKEDKLETLFEMIDIMHFIYNMIITLEMDGKDVFILYYLKNKENFRRYSNQY